EVVRRALRDALGQSAVPQLQLRPEMAGAPQPIATALPGVLAGGAYPSRWIPDDVRLKADTTDDGDADVPSAPYVASAFRRTSETPDIKPMIPLGQFRDTFIIAVDNEGIAIIDQHVAHE